MALFAVFCLSAVTASGAFAAVKKGELVSKATGKVLTKKKFTSSGTTQTLETTSGAKVTCTAATGSGEVTSTTTATQTVKFTGCVNASGSKCKSTGLKAGEIEVGTISETLGWKLGSKKESLVLLSAISGTFSFECGEVKNEAKGSFLAPVGAGNEGSANAKAKFSFTAAQTKGVQAETAYETLAGTEVKNVIIEAKLLKASEPFVQAGQEGTETVTLEEEAEFL